MLVKDYVCLHYLFYAHKMCENNALLQISEEVQGDEN